MSTKGLKPGSGASKLWALLACTRAAPESPGLLFRKSAGRLEALSGPPVSGSLMLAPVLAAAGAVVDVAVGVVVGAVVDVVVGAVVDVAVGVVVDVPPGAVVDVPPGAVVDLPPGAVVDVPPGAVVDVPGGVPVGTGLGTIGVTEAFGPGTLKVTGLGPVGTGNGLGTFGSLKTSNTG